MVFTFSLFGIWLGGGDNSTPTQLVEEDPSHSLVLERVPLLPRFPDMNDKDVTILNIQENRNEIKTQPIFILRLSSSGSSQ